MLCAVLVGGCTAGTGEGSVRAPVASLPSGPDDVAVLGGYAGAFDEVTQEFRVRSEALQERAGQGQGESGGIVALYGELREVAADARAKYGRIAAPAPVQAVHQRILQLFDRQVELLAAVVEAADAGDNDAVADAVQGLIDLTEEFDVVRRQIEQAIANCGQACVT